MLANIACKWLLSDHKRIYTISNYFITTELLHSRRCNISSENIFILYRNIYGLNIYLWSKNIVFV